jgi:hypothetical protein
MAKANSSGRHSVGQLLAVIPRSTPLTATAHYILPSLPIIETKLRKQDEKYMPILTKTAHAAMELASYQLAATD